MRIAITGTHGVGKTTLANNLVTSPQSIAFMRPLISEIARRVAKMSGYKDTQAIMQDTENRKMEFQLKVLGWQTGAEFMLYSRGFISDRSVLDIIAYMDLYGLKAEAEALGRCAMEYASRNYDLILYVPLAGWEAKNDGFRLTDRESQVKVDRYIARMVDKLSNVRVITDTTIDGRVKEAMGLIRGLRVSA